MSNASKFVMASIAPIALAAIPLMVVKVQSLIAPEPIVNPARIPTPTAAPVATGIDDKYGVDLSVFDGKCDAWEFLHGANASQGWTRDDAVDLHSGEALDFETLAEICASLGYDIDPWQ